MAKEKDKPFKRIIPGKSTRHQLISSRLIGFFFQQNAHENGQLLHGNIDVVFDSDVIFQPDLVFVEKSNAKIIGKEAIHGAPDLIIEIMDAGNRLGPLTTHSKVYAKYGVRELWLVDVEVKVIQQFILENGKWVLEGALNDNDRIRSVVVPNFTFLLWDLFQH